MTREKQEVSNPNLSIRILPKCRRPGAHQSPKKGVKRVINPHRRGVRKMCERERKRVEKLTLAQFCTKARMKQLSRRRRTVLAVVQGTGKERKRRRHAGSLISFGGYPLFHFRTLHLANKSSRPSPPTAKPRPLKPLLGPAASSAGHSQSR